MKIDEARRTLALARVVQEQANQLWQPPDEAQRPKLELVLPGSVFKNSRQYVEKIVFQINGCFEAGCYDACSVMIRRLLETLIIEAFETHNIRNQIEDKNGSLVGLSELIDRTLDCNQWKVGRVMARELKKLNQVGDLSAHSRRYLAHRHDIEKISPSLRVITQELLLQRQQL